MIDEAFLLLIYLIYEGNRARPTSAMYSVLRTARTINESHVPTNSGFVFLQAKSVNYSSFFDDNLSYSVSGSMVAWRPQYCQWQEGLPTDYFSSSAFVSYHSVWVDEPIPGDGHVDPRDRNPTTVYPSYVRQMDVTIGPITISSELFSDVSAHRYEPSAADLQRFDGSEAHKSGFRFLSKGYFYRAIGGDLRERLIHVQATQRVGGPAAAAYVMDHCRVGDVRVRHMRIAPQRISVFGWLENNTILRGTFRGFRIGAARPALVAPRCVIAAMAERSKEIWVLRAILLVRLIPFIWRLARDTKGRAWCFTLAGFSMLYIKCVIWSTPWMNADLWGPVALGVWTSFGMTRSTRRRRF
jgi:hypothetical protein